MNKNIKTALISIVSVMAVCLALAAIYLPGYLEASMNKVTPHTPYEISIEAKALHASLIVGDLHSDSLLWHRDLTERSRIGHVDLPRLREGNVAIQVFPAVTKSPKGQNYESNTGDSDNITLLVITQRWPRKTWGSLTERALFQSKKLHALEKVDNDSLRVIRTKDDLVGVLNARKTGKETLAALLSFEGAHALDQNIDNVEILYQAGFRVMGLHHFFDNKLGGSLHGTSKSGLTDFGQQVVKEIEASGAIIDVAHSSEASVDDVLALATRPVMVSHTGVKGTCDSARNISDAHMKKIAIRGGLIGIGYWDGAVCDTSPEGVVKAIRYAIHLVGVSHIALGSDYDGSTEVTFDTSEIAILTDTMLKQGFTESEVRAVMGENLVRFFLENLPAS